MFGVVSILLTILSGCGGSSSHPDVTGPTVVSVAITPPSPAIKPGATEQFTAIATYSDGSTSQVTDSATWTSSDTSKVTIQSTGAANPGLATAVATGGSGITASLGGHSATTGVAVNLKSVGIMPSNPPVIAVGQTQPFKAKAVYTDSSISDVTSFATWVSSDKSKATVQSAGQQTPGLATAVKAGAPNIQATFGGVTALVILDISSNSAPTGVTLSAINPSLAPGATLQLIAVEDFADGSTTTITTLADWASSDSTKVSVQSNGDAAPGLVTAITGSANITASYTVGSTTFTSPPVLVTVRSNAVTRPLMDMTLAQNYLGFQGGLYQNSSSVMPAQHDADGKTAAASIQPRMQNGNVSSNGAVVFLGIGMSNATIEFSAFITAAAGNSNVNHTTLAMEDGAHGAVTACPWTVAQGSPTTDCPGVSGVSADNQYDRVRDTVLATAVGAPSAPANCGGPPNPVPCLTENQVQAIWLKNANPEPALQNVGSMTPTTVCANEVPPATFVTEACVYEWQLGRTIRAAKSRYPNLKQIFISTRIYAGYATSALNPEPYAYEYGFSGKWLIQAQVDQVNGSGIDPVAGDLNYNNGTAAWTAWGNYLWADGDTPRSDGLFWCNSQATPPCNGESDYLPDGTHPNSEAGADKVVNVLMDFFASSVYTPWFRP